MKNMQTIKYSNGKMSFEGPPSKEAWKLSKKDQDNDIIMKW